MIYLLRCNVMMCNASLGKLIPLYIFKGTQTAIKQYLSFSLTSSAASQEHFSCEILRLKSMLVELKAYTPAPQPVMDFHLCLNIRCIVPDVRDSIQRGLENQILLPLCLFINITMVQNRQSHTETSTPQTYQTRNNKSISSATLV